MLAAAPLLRSPPFPSIKLDVAAVSRSRDTPCAPPQLATQLLPVVRAMREARVGGTFWAPPAMLGEAATILCPGSAASAEAGFAVAEHIGAAQPIAVLLPAGRAASRVAARLRARGAYAVIGDVDPWSWVRPGVAVHVRTSDERAFIALAAGANLFVPGMTRERMLAELSARLFEWVSYRDPFTDAPAAIESVIAMLADWRRQLDDNRAVAAATGMARWKRRRIDAFLWSGSPTALRHARTSGAAVGAARSRPGAIACWPSRAPAELSQEAKQAQVEIIRVEDGFVRSLGLGSDLVPPWSVVVDPVGIYYDPAGPSRLEQILATAHFTASELDRARALIELIVREGIGKYAVERAISDPPVRTSRRTILIAGQVQDDLSMRLGAPDLGGNLGLLQRARAAEPDAEIWYRPHPDVEAGHRRGAIPDAAILVVADRIVRGGTLSSLLDTVDGVHVATSLTGFEALLRGREVTTHGQPFYAGWGLTRDLAPQIARRGRLLSLPELVAGTLIRYPRYIDPRTGLPCSPEILFDRLVNDAVAVTVLTHLRRWQGRARNAILRRLG